MKKNIIITGGNGQDAKILARNIKKYQINFLIKKKDKFLIKNKNITYSKINLAEILMETISLETPDYPKRSGVSLASILGEKVDVKNSPFSVLDKLKKNL